MGGLGADGEGAWEPSLIRSSTASLRAHSAKGCLASKPPCYHLLTVLMLPGWGHTGCEPEDWRVPRWSVRALGALAGPTAPSCPSLVRPWWLAEPRPLELAACCRSSGSCLVALL